MSNNLENTAQQENGLVALLKENKISEESALALSSSFNEFFELAKGWKEKAAVFLADENLSDEEKVKEAKKGRLALVKVRTGIDKKRKELNEDDQNRIADRNAAAKVLTALTTPIEEMLEAKEKEAEIKEKERLDAIKAERTAKLQQFSVDCTFFDLANMPEEAFQVLLDNSTLAFQKRIDDEKIAAEKALHLEKSASRKEQLILLGFKTHESGAFVHELFDVHEEIESYTDDQWKNFSDKLAKDISDLVEEKRKAKEAEDNRLKAEKEELERKNSLLEQQEKEKQAKHNTAIYRQQAAARMNVVLEYTLAHEMTEEGWIAYFKEKDSEYQAEQNRIFIEKKKKERDEAIAKSEADKKAEEERTAELAPDKDKIMLHVNSLELPSLEILNFTSEESKDLYNLIDTKFEGFKKWAIEQIQKLK